MAADGRSIPDISKLTLGQLTQLAEQVTTLRANLLVERRQELALRIKELIVAEGISLDDVVRELGVTASRTNERATRRQRTPRRGKVEAKYRNPAELAQAWTGRGRKPHWVKAHLAGGGAMDELLIIKADS